MIAMMKCLLRITVVGALMVSVVGAETDPNKTCKMFNGRFWHSLIDDAKIGYVVGASDSMTLISSYDWAQADKIGTYLPQLNFGEITKAVDRFYDTPRKCPYSHPLGHAAYRVSG